MQEDKIKNNPLVSVIVLTYNSSKFVLETLESIKAQTYKNIELVISDDCSTDNSVEICKQWLEENKERFVGTHLITYPVNTGIPANKNRGLEKCRGEWIKGIAADDLLLPDSILLFVDFIKNHLGVSVISSNVIKFTEKEETKTEIENTIFFNNNNITAIEQYKYLLRSNRILAPGVIIKKEIIDYVGGYDESFPLIEDYPFWLKLSKKNIKIHCLDKLTVKYRISDQGLSSMTNHYNKTLIPNIFFLAKKVRLKYCLSDLPFIEKIDLLYSYFVDYCFIKLGNRNNKLNRFALKITRVGNLFVLYRKFLSLFSLDYRNIKYIK